MQVYTIGHSNRSLAWFMELLIHHRIENIIDVRTFPGSNKFPHFNQEGLSKTLVAHGIGYYHLPELGGRRRTVLSDSPNTAWKNESFRSYADHMLGDDFKNGLSELLSIAQKSRSAYMCAESLWWQCHRRLISDALTVRGVEVLHILSKSSPKEHPLTGFANFDGEQLTYPGQKLLPLSS